MNTQPEALRLANELLTDRALECFDWAHDAGYKLRRLHEVNQMLVEAAEMALEALESWQKTCLDCGRASDELGKATTPIQTLHQALAKAKEQA